MHLFLLYSEQSIQISFRAGKFKYRVTEESLMDRLTTDTHAACLSIQPECRLEIANYVTFM